MQGVTMRNIFAALRYDSLSLGTGTVNDPLNVTVLGLPAVFGGLKAGDDLHLGPGLYHWKGGRQVACEMPDDVSVWGAGISGGTTLQFEVEDEVEHFIAFRYSGGSSFRLVNVTLRMPDLARATTAVQAFGQYIWYRGVKVLNAHGPSESERGAPESFPLFASSRIPGHNVHIPGESCIESCVVRYREAAHQHYSTAIVNDSSSSGSSVTNCVVHGRIHAAFSGGGNFTGCMSLGARHFWYHDTYALSGVSIMRCTATQAEVFIKDISPDGVSHLQAEENVMSSRSGCQPPVSFAYIQNGSIVDLRRNTLVMRDGASGGFICFDPTRCREFVLRDNLVAGEQACMLQAPDVLRAIPGCESKRNRLRTKDAILTLYSDHDRELASSGTESPVGAQAKPEVE